MFFKNSKQRCRNQNVTDPVLTDKKKPASIKINVALKSIVSPEQSPEQLNQHPAKPAFDTFLNWIFHETELSAN
jgi:hypothetical protein